MVTAEYVQRRSLYFIRTRVCGQSCIELEKLNAECFTIRSFVCTPASSERTNKNFMSQGGSSAKIPTALFYITMAFFIIHAPSKDYRLVCH